MTVRPPSMYGNASAADVVFDALGHEIQAEKASALGRAGRQVEITLAALGTFERGSDRWAVALRNATEAVYAYFIQRELCGFSRHQDVIREYAIPREVLVRLGAK